MICTPTATHTIPSPGGVKLPHHRRSRYTTESGRTTKPVSGAAKDLEADRLAFETERALPVSRAAEKGKACPAWLVFRLIGSLFTVR